MLNNEKHCSPMQNTLIIIRVNSYITHPTVLPLVFALIKNMYEVEKKLNDT